MCDLAVMMHAHCKDHAKAYELFTRSLDIDPTNVNSLCNRECLALARVHGRNLALQ